MKPVASARRLVDRALPSALPSALDPAAAASSGNLKAPPCSSRSVCSEQMGTRRGPDEEKARAAAGTETDKEKARGQVMAVTVVSPARQREVNITLEE
jgi:hypothetical protein